MNSDVIKLSELLDQIKKGADNADDSEKVTFDAILKHVGRRSFGPLLLLAGLITLAPLIGDIPGVPTTMGIFVLLIAVQLLIHKEHIWLPDWILDRSVKKDNINKALEWIRSPAQFLDRWLRPRLSLLVEGVGVHIIAVVCIIIALAMPFLEFIPFSANGAGAALTAFGLALISQDGLLALVALVIAVGTISVIIYNLI